MYNIERQSNTINHNFSMCAGFIFKYIFCVFREVSMGVNCLIMVNCMLINYMPVITKTHNFIVSILWNRRCICIMYHNENTMIKQILFLLSLHIFDLHTIYHD